MSDSAKRRGPKLKLEKVEKSSTSNQLSNETVAEESRMKLRDKDLQFIKELGTGIHY